MWDLPRKLFLAVAMVTSLLLAGCGGSEEEPYVERPVEELYNDAMNLLAEGEYKLSIAAFNEVDRQHPYSIWATKAQLMTAYVYYLRDDYDESILAIDRFIELHPGNKDTPYAYYLRAIVYYEQIVDIDRDQRITLLAMQALQDVLRRYPDTAYARDTKLKIDLTRDHLAGKEMAIGRYYLERREYAAAINRFKNVVKDYQTTTHIQEALHRLVESYLSLGINYEAEQAAAVLGHNFPASKWYEKSYALVQGISPEINESWYEEVWNWVF
ncbi:outer membrane protein assembly factor BamD [Curvivirga sp.]|uniref:outer membrane protein assembly factor BamD n=1 Tax=Curvivirga sp. TaxID=2856848 RepID=UPI003B5B98F5